MMKHEDLKVGMTVKVEPDSDWNDIYVGTRIKLTRIYADSCVGIPSYPADSPAIRAGASQQSLCYYAKSSGFYPFIKLELGKLKIKDLLVP